MDPTIAALIGAGIGMAGTVVSPLLASGRAHKARRREMMREVYADAMRIFGEVPRVAQVEELKALQHRMFEVKVQISLVASVSAYKGFVKFEPLVKEWLRVAEETSDSNEISSDSPAAAAFKGEIKKGFNRSINAFLGIVRRDIGTEDATWKKIPSVISSELEEIRGFLGRFRGSRSGGAS